MNALTVLQPWAQLLAIGAKRYETRSWSTSYRGLLIIHAGKNKTLVEDELGDYVVSRLSKAKNEKLNPIDLYRQDAEESNMFQAQCLIALTDSSLRKLVELEYGAAIAVGELTHCIACDAAFRKTLTPQERAFGGFADGRYAWEITNVQRIKPLAVRGQQGLWKFEHEIEIVVPEMEM